MSDLDLAVSTHNFLVKHDVETLADMAEVVKNMRSRYDSSKIETTETARRFATLTYTTGKPKSMGKILRYTNNGVV
jgi:hypothetical protein